MYSMQIKLLGLTCRVEIIVISIIVGILLGTHLFCSCTKVSAKEMTKEIENRINGIINDVGGRIKEGFALANAAPTTYKMGKGVPDSYDSNRLESISQNLGTHIGPKVPLPAGQMFFFANNTFSPDCCVPPQSGVSNGDGCACVTQEQINYISSRGGNRAVCGEF